MEASLDKPFIRRSPFIVGDLAVIVRITGDIKGQAIISMDESVSKQVVSSMMMGMEITELDDLSKSAISELGNMILGKTATNLSVLGVQNNITPPTLITGNNVQVSTSTNQSITIPFKTTIGEIFMDISIKEGE